MAREKITVSHIGTAAPPPESVDAAEAEVLVAIAYRRRMFRIARPLTAAVVLIAVAAGLLRHSWLDVVIGGLGAVAVFAVMFYQSALRVERLTGLSIRAQSRLWERYRMDPMFAAVINRALRGDGLVQAIRELTRPLDADIDVDDGIDERMANE
jgi:hypothetical protein